MPVNLRKRDPRLVDLDKRLAAERWELLGWVEHMAEALSLLFLICIGLMAWRHQYQVIVSLVVALTSIGTTGWIAWHHRRERTAVPRWLLKRAASSVRNSREATLTRSGTIRSGE